MSTATPPSRRTRVRSVPSRARYDFDTLTDIIDSAWLCHIAFVSDGEPRLLPSTRWREGEYLYIHGAKASRMLKALHDSEACVCISHVDSLVLARSAFHHSMDYRSVVAYGRFEQVQEEEARRKALRALIERFEPGRWDKLRPMTDKEFAATSIWRLRLDEASAKVRDIGVNDDDEDRSWPVWAGIVPLRLSAGEPLTAPDSAVADAPGALRDVLDRMARR